MSLRAPRTAQKDIQRNDVGERGEHERDEGHHHGLDDAVDQALGVADEHPPGLLRLDYVSRHSRNATSLLKRLVDDDGVERVGEEAGQVHHDVDDDGAHLALGDHQQDVLLNAALLRAVRQQRQHGQEHHTRRGQTHRQPRHSGGIRLVLRAQLLLRVRAERGGDVEGHVGVVEAEGEGGNSHGGEERAEGHGSQHGGFEGQAVVDEAVD